MSSSLFDFVPIGSSSTIGGAGRSGSPAPSLESGSDDVVKQKGPSPPRLSKDARKNARFKMVTADSLVHLAGVTAKVADLSGLYPRSAFSGTKEVLRQGQDVLAAFVGKLSENYSTWNQDLIKNEDHRAALHEVMSLAIFAVDVAASAGCELFAGEVEDGVTVGLQKIFRKFWCRGVSFPFSGGV